MLARRFGLWALALVLIAVALLPLPDFWIIQLNYIGLYSLLCLGLVLLTGVAGLTSFGQTAFVGIGAYSTAWLTLNTGLSPWLKLSFATPTRLSGNPAGRRWPQRARRRRSGPSRRAGSHAL